MIEAILFFTYAFFAVNWIAGSTLTAQIAAFFGVDSGASSSFVSNAVTIAKIIGKLYGRLYSQQAVAQKIYRPRFCPYFCGQSDRSVCTVLSDVHHRTIPDGFWRCSLCNLFRPVVIHYFTPAQRPTVNALNSCAYNFGAVLALLIVGPHYRNVPDMAEKHGLLRCYQRYPVRPLARLRRRF
jgi:hypothetical protein